MKDTEYTYAVAYIKTLENKMLTMQDAENLLNSPDTKSAMKILSDRGYESDEKSLSDIDAVLKNEQERIWGQVRDCVPDGAPLDILLYRNDFHNLKTVLKAFITDSDWEHLILTPYLTEPKAIYDAVTSRNFQILPEHISDIAKRSYDIITETSDGQLAEIYLDKALAEQTIKAADDIGIDIIIKWAKLNILIANMKIAMRAAGKQKSFIENALIKTVDGNNDRLLNAAVSGQSAVISEIEAMGYKTAAEELTKSFSMFEKWCDNQKIRLIRAARQKSFGFEPIFGFILGKETEIQAVRMIFSAKQNGVDKEIIKERLRDLYV